MSVVDALCFFSKSRRPLNHPLLNHWDFVIDSLSSHIEKASDTNFVHEKHKTKKITMEETLNVAAQELVKEIQERAPLPPCVDYCTDYDEPLVCLEWKEPGLFIDVTNSTLEIATVLATSSGNLVHSSCIYSYDDASQREKGFQELERHFSELFVSNPSRFS